MKKYFSLIFLLFCININASDEAEIKELKEQVKKILSRLEYLENRVAKKEIKIDDSKKVVAIEEPKQNLELTTKETVLSVGGKIELDFNYASLASPLNAKSIAVADAQNSPHQTFNAANSRIWVKTRTPSSYGLIRTLVESDFSGVQGTETNTNSSGLRLRHAYINVGEWSVGQTNSIFNTSTPLELLYTPLNDVFVRQPLIKYSSKNDLFDYDISLEQPETTLLTQDAKIITPKDDIIPDILARARYYPSWGEVAMAIMGRYINQDSYGDFTNKSSAFGWGVNLSAKIKVGYYDDIRFHTTYGVGLGRYVAYNAYPAGYVDASGEIDLQPTYAYSLGYRHWWSKELRSTMALTYAGTKNDEEFLQSIIDKTNINRSVYASHINLLWTPVLNSLIGVEYVKAKRVVESGDEGDMDSAMLRFRYDF
ncbi:MAG: porin [Campylobacterales bacterium]|nr:porin [Campylobacterales bacterium]